MRRQSICQQCAAHYRGWEVGDDYIMVDECACGDWAYTIPRYGTQGWVWGG